MNKIYLYQIGFNQNTLVLIGLENISELSKEKLNDVMCVTVDLKYKKISEISSYISQIKNGEWLSVKAKEHENLILNKIYETFSKEDIEEKIIKPLSSKK